jgi:hypothetical protein
MPQVYPTGRFPPQETATALGKLLAGVIVTESVPGSPAEIRKGVVGTARLKSGITTWMLM